MDLRMQARAGSFLQASGQPEAGPNLTAVWRGIVACSGSEEQLAAATCGHSFEWPRHERSFVGQHI